jgi:hypothetical protein
MFATETGEPITVLSLEYSEIPEVFFMPHHEQWHQQDNQIMWSELLQQCDEICDRQTDMNGAHKVFFAYAKAWRIPKNWTGTFSSYKKLIF